MTHDIRVDLDQLDSLATQLRSLAEFVNEHLDILDRKVASLHAGGTWVGAAADAHKAAHDSWAAGAAEFSAGIDSMHDAAKTAHTAYDSAVKANARMFRR